MNDVPPPDPRQVAEDVRRALAEDLGPGDASAALFDAGATARAQLLCRQAAVICGRPWVDETLAQVDRRLTIDWRVAEGEAVAAGTVVAELAGPTTGLLGAERTLLNFLQLLSATATRTRRHVEALGGRPLGILDTRKTLPGLRAAQKYAVRCGGGTNHRMGLYDAVMLKENHIRALGGVRAAIERARRARPDLPLIVEVETLAQMEEALAAGADHLLLDNFPPEALREAVRRNAGRARLEASGNITLATLPAVADTGVDFVSLGTLTKDVEAVDLSLRFVD